MMNVWSGTWHPRVATGERNQWGGETVRQVMDDVIEEVVPEVRFELTRHEDNGF
jgi:hypothetical protein